MSLTLFSEENCVGKSQAISQDTPDLGTYNFLALAKSLVVSGDPWVVYTEKNYKGKYELFQNGSHITLPGFVGVICSVRLVKGGLANPQISLFSIVSHGGKEVSLEQDARSLIPYRIDKAASHRVQKGAWQLFQGPEYSGDSLVTLAGDEIPHYENIGWDNMVSSAKPYH